MIAPSDTVAYRAYIDSMLQDTYICDKQDGDNIIVCSCDPDTDEILSEATFKASSPTALKQYHADFEAWIARQPAFDPRPEGWTDDYEAEMKARYDANHRGMVPGSDVNAQGRRVCGRPNDEVAE